jgi:Ca-activated chloride channel homolog
VIALPEIDRQKILVQKAGDGQYYFMINDFPKPSEKANAAIARKTPARIVIYWDASGSRGKADHKRELKILETYLSGHGAQKIEVDLVLFRNEAEAPQRFVIEKGNSEKLVAALSAVQYDGGTQIGALSPAADTPVPDLYLLFSDGVSNFGKEEPTGFKAPVYALSGDATANHAFLRYLSLQTGGEYFNLNRLDGAAIASRIGVSAFSFVSAESVGAGIEDIHPRASLPIQGRFAVAGRLDADKAKLRINYGVDGKTLESVEYEISRADAAEGDLLRVFFAQKKVEELQVFPKRNEMELIAVGKEHGLVTPGTSLIVLESLQQYVEHKIAPPSSLPDMRTRYFAMVEAGNRKEQQRVTNKLDQMVALWQRRVDWWNTRFSYPKDFKYRAKEEKPSSLPESAAPAHGALESSRMEQLPAAPASRQQATNQAAPTEALTRERGGAPAKRVAASDEEAVRQDKSGQLKDGQEEIIRGPEGRITIREWDPATPYLAELKKAQPETYLKVYLGQRTQFGTSPAFYLDCADFLFKQNQDKLAVRVLSNIAELELENPQLLRVLGHRLAQANLPEPARMVFEEVLRLRPEEPQSYRDLALVLDAQEQYGRAVELLYHVVTHQWDRFSEIEVVALMELNRTIARAKRAGIKDFPVDPRLIKLLDVDVRIVLTWDADMTDMDLWVTEPSGEKANYSHKLTTIGGLVSRDITDGYGPEEYVLRKVLNGRYQVQVNYYGSGSPTLTGAVTLQVDVFTAYGRPDEKRRSMTVRLKERQEVVTIGEVEY